MGDLLVIHDTGAHGHAMGYNYNGRLRSAELLLKEDGTCVWAYREQVWIVPNSVGGGTSGVQIPFTIHNAGARVKGTFDIKTRTFTPEAAAEG